MRYHRWLSTVLGVLAVSSLPPPAAAIAPGETVSGFVDGEAEQDVLPFTSATADILVLRETVTSGTLATRFHLKKTINNDGCSLGGGTSGDGFGAAGTVGTIFTCPVTAADYDLIIPLEIAPGNGAGDYRMHMQSLAAPVGATALTIGGTTAGSIGLGGEMDAFTLALDAQDVVTITVSRTSGALDPNFRLFGSTGPFFGDAVCGGAASQPDPLNNPVFSDECGSIIAHPYVLLVYDLDDSGTTLADEYETGDYTVTVACVQGPCLTAVTTTTTVTSTSTTSTGPFASTTTTSTTLPGTVDQLVTGKQLVLKAKTAKPQKRSLTLVSADAGIDLGLGNGSTDDPRTAGATLRVFSGPGGFDGTYPLPASRWKLIGAEGLGKGYKYVDGNGSSGPLRNATLKPGVLKLGGKGAGLDLLLANDPNPVHLVLTMGTTRYCATFGGNRSFKAGKSYSAKDAAAPAACP